ncbi:MAG: hypothetical protein KC423_17840 [Anaerolineales bacterium]|nr:hypothetical protein [Anaerolineales bacterium]
MSLPHHALREQPLPQDSTPEEAFLQQTAQAVRRWGLKLPVLLALQAGTPLTFLAAQCLWIVQPTASLFSSDSHTITHLAHLLENPDQLTRFRHYLEQVS